MHWFWNSLFKSSMAENGNLKNNSKFPLSRMYYDILVHDHFSDTLNWWGITLTQINTVLITTGHGVQFAIITLRKVSTA